MRVQVKRGFVNIHDRDYFHPLMVSLDGQYVDVICGLSSSRVDVYRDGQFYCEAAYAPGAASSLMRPAEKGCSERGLRARMRQPASYSVMSGFPPVPQRLRVMIADYVVRQTKRRTVAASCNRILLRIKKKKKIRYETCTYKYQGGAGCDYRVSG